MASKHDEKLKIWTINCEASNTTITGLATKKTEVVPLETLQAVQSRLANKDAQLQEALEQIKFLKADYHYVGRQFDICKQALKYYATTKWLSSTKIAVKALKDVMS